MLKNLGDLLNGSGLNVADSPPYICNATGSCSWSGTNTMGKDFDLLRVLFIFPLMIELPFFCFWEEIVCGSCWERKREMRFEILRVHGKK